MAFSISVVTSVFQSDLVRRHKDLLIVGIDNKSLLFLLSARKQNVLASVKLILKTNSIFRICCNVKKRNENAVLFHPGL